MSKTLKRILIAVGSLVGLLILISVTLFFFVDTQAYKPRLEKAASKVLGMEVKIGGRMGITIFPELHVRLDDVHIRNQGMDIASMKEVRLEIALSPLLRKEVQINSITLQHPVISLTRDRAGMFNFERHEEAKGAAPALALDHLSFSNGTFLYTDEQSGGKFEAGNFSLDVRNLQIAERNSAEILKNLSFTAEFTCPEIHSQRLTFSDVRFSGRGKDGIITLDPVTMRLFGGQGSGSIGMDFSHPVSSYAIRSSLSKFQIEEYLKTLSEKKVGEGSMDFSANLSMQGNTARDLKQTASGEVSLRGVNIMLYGNDLDREFARFESSQNFNLVDAGAFFFAGPFGLLVTKGYNFASIFQGSGGSTSIGKLFSDWKVEHGIAQARDVASATRQNRMALKGRINFVTERFDDVTIALIDAQGCARVKQKIRGPFQKPVVEKPNILMSLAGPALNLYKQARAFFPGGKCEVFYTGSVPAPK
jgi:AsmA protein